MSELVSEWHFKITLYRHFIIVIGIGWIQRQKRIRDDVSIKNHSRCGVCSGISVYNE